MFAFVKGAVGDLAQEAGVVIQGANVPPIDLVGTGFEMVGAEGSKPRQQCVDLELGGQEGVEGLVRPLPRTGGGSGLTVLCAAGHVGGSLVSCILSVA